MVGAYDIQYDRLQILSKALHAGDSAIWVGEAFGSLWCRFNVTYRYRPDTSSKLATRRLQDVSGGSSPEKKQKEPAQPGSPPVEAGTLSKMQHFVTPTLSHLFALLAASTDVFPPRDTSLIVIDTISALFALAFPKSVEQENKQQTPQKKSDAAQWASGRRWAVISDLLSKLNRIAVTRNIAIVLLSQTVTRVRSDTGALLYPAISGAAWDAGINNRIALYRDWSSRTADASQCGSSLSSIRFAGVVKAKGIIHQGVGRTAGFVIEKVTFPLHIVIRH